MSLKEKLQNIPSGEFVSIKVLREIMNETSIQKYLDGSVNAVADDQTTLSTAHYVARNAPKLLAVLIIANLEEYVLDFLSKSPSDDVFPANPERPLEAFGEGEPWERFCLTQWKIAPFMHTSIHLEPPSEVDLRKLFTLGETLGSGTFGIVRKVQISGEHLDGVPSQTWLARKQVKADEEHGSKSLAIVMREIDVLRRRKHENILPILCSFSHWEKSHGANAIEERKIFIVTPLFEMNMQEWMKQSLPESWLMPDSRHYLYRCTEQLLRGLAALHRRDECGRATAHHDLKPTNIFIDSSKVVIGDLGSASLKSIGEGSAATEGRWIGTLQYCPPEYFNESGDRAKGVEHGRAYDMWSVGCIMLQVAILICWEGDPCKIQEFKNNQKELEDNRRRFKPKGQRDPLKTHFHNSIEAINEWLTNMQKFDVGDAKEGTRLRRYIRIVIGMLRSDPYARLYSWEAVLDLYDLLNPDVGHFERQQYMFQYIERPDPHQVDPDAYRDTPLHRAAERGDSFRVMHLVTAGWSVQVKNRVGKTPIELAKDNKHYGTVDCLQQTFLQGPAQPRVAFAEGSTSHVMDGKKTGFDLKELNARRISQRLPRSGIYPKRNSTVDHKVAILLPGKSCLEEWIDNESQPFLYLWGEAPVEETVQRLAEKMSENDWLVIFSSSRSEGLAQRMESTEQGAFGPLEPDISAHNLKVYLEEIFDGGSKPKIPVLVILHVLQSEMGSSAGRNDLESVIAILRAQRGLGNFKMLITSQTYQGEWNIDDNGTDIDPWSGSKHVSWP